VPRPCGYDSVQVEAGSMRDDSPPTNTVSYRVHSSLTSSILHMPGTAPFETSFLSIGMADARISAIPFPGGSFHVLPRGAGQNLPSNSVSQLLIQGGKILKGNTMSGMSLYEKLLEYHHIFQQIMQGILPGPTAMYRDSSLFLIVHSLREEGCSDALSKGGFNG
jgi:hypothetical protein